MKATIEIDDDVYNRLEAQAQAQGRRLDDLLMEGIQILLVGEHPPSIPKRRIRLPLIDSARPGKLHIPDDIVSIIETQEDLERHEASLR